MWGSLVAWSALRSMACAVPPSRGWLWSAAPRAEIAAITGHSLRGVRSILDARYLHRDPELVRAAIHKPKWGTRNEVRRPELEQILQNDLQNGLAVLSKERQKAL